MAALGGTFCPTLAFRTASDPFHTAKATPKGGLVSLSCLMSVGIASGFKSRL
jgi:hypothetical protein